MPDAPKDVNAADLGPRRRALLRERSVHGGITKYTGSESGKWSDITPEKLAKAKEGFGSIQVDPANKNNILAMENYMPLYSTDGGTTWGYIAAQGANQSETATPDWYSKVSQSHFGWGGRNLRFDPFRPGTVWESDAYLTWKTTDIYAKVVHWESFTAGHEEVVGTSGFISPPSGKTMLYSGAADVYGFRHTSLDGWPTQILLGRGTPPSFKSTARTLKKPTRTSWPSSARGMERPRKWRLHDGWRGDLQKLPEYRDQSPEPGGDASPSPPPAGTWCGPRAIPRRPYTIPPIPGPPGNRAPGFPPRRRISGSATIIT